MVHSGDPNGMIALVVKPATFVRILDVQGDFGMITLL